MGKEVAIIQQPQVPAFSYGEVEKIAGAIARGGLFGSKDPYAVLTLCMLAQAEGQHPAVVFRDYDLIQGKPAKKAEAMLRDFLGSGGTVKWNRLDDECADATFSHPQGGTVTINWTLARATKAGLGGKDMWKKYPRQMLRSRVVSEGVRTVCPNATSGLYVPEEVRDFDGGTISADTPPTPEPKRARDLKAEQPKQIEAKPDKKRAKAEDWLAWLKAEVNDAGGEVDAVRAIFADPATAKNLAVMEADFPDIYAEAVQLAPTGEGPDTGGQQESGPTTMADQLGLDDPVQRVLNDLETAAHANDAKAVEKIIAAAEKQRADFTDDQLLRLETAYSKARGRVTEASDA